MVVKNKTPRNTKLVGGTERYSRSAVYKRKAIWKKSGKKTLPKVSDAMEVDAPVKTKSVEVGGAKNGKSRTVAAEKLPKYYPVEADRQLKKSRKTKAPIVKLRTTITPGTVLILLAGRFRGKRVVFLKQMPSGLLLVTGPYKVNGVPLRRVNQSYVIATGTKVDVEGQKFDNVTDDLFKTETSKDADQKKSGRKSAAALFDSTKRSAKKPAEKKEKKPLDAKFVELQKSVDAALLQSVKKVPQLSAYLSSSFSLSKGELPHMLKF